MSIWADNTGRERHWNYRQSTYKTAENTADGKKELASVEFAMRKSRCHGNTASEADATERIIETDRFRIPLGR